LQPYVPEKIKLVQPAGVDGDLFKTDMVFTHAQEVELGLASETPDEVFKIKEEEGEVCTDCDTAERVNLLIRAWMFESVFSRINILKEIKPK
jgi:hypothetical protein